MSAAAPGISVSQILPMVVMMGLSKYDLQEMGYTHHVEAAYVVVQIFCLGALGLMYQKIAAMVDNGVKIKIPEVKQMGQVVSPAMEQTAKEYDMSKWKEQIKQIVMGACILGGIYYKWQYLLPLVLQLLGSRSSSPRWALSAHGLSVAQAMSSRKTRLPL